MTVRIGLIGAGGITNPHVKGYLARPDVATIVAVADVDAEAANRRADQAGGAKVYSDFNDLIADPDVDAVDICLPHFLHAPAILAAAKAGKHIICEKPLCLTVDEADAITAAIDASGITLMCAHNQLYFPAVAKARELIEDGTLGSVYEIRTTDSFFNNFDPANAGWRADKAKIGGGELIDTGYHPTYLMLFLAGQVPTQVAAMLSKHRLEFMDGEDSAQVLVRFADGKVGHIVTSWAYAAAGCTERFSAVGDQGQLWSDGTTLWVRKRGGETEEHVFDAVETIPAEVGDFAARIEAGQAPIHNHLDGINVLKVILGAYKSAQDSTIVTLADL
jgi:predicted dehydrogenase